VALDAGQIKGVFPVVKESGNTEQVATWLVRYNHVAFHGAALRQLRWTTGMRGSLDGVLQSRTIARNPGRLA